MSYGRTQLGTVDNSIAVPAGIIMGIGLLLGGSIALWWWTR